MGVPLFKEYRLPDGTSRVEFKGKVIIKDIENRSWPLPKGFKLPQRIYVHVSKTEDNGALAWLMGLGFPAMTTLMMFSKRLPRGAIIGEVDIIRCVTESSSIWFTGPFGFVLANPVAYEKPIPCRGQERFFTPKI